MTTPMNISGRSSGRYKVGFLRCVLLVTLCISAGACQTTKKRNVEKEIVSPEKEIGLARELDQNLFRTFGHWAEPVVENFIAQMVMTLAKSDRHYGDLKDAKVHLLATSIPYSAPGFNKTFYFSKGMLSQAKYENELAFLVATQLAFLKENVTSRNLAGLQGQELGESLVLLPTAPQSLQKNFIDGGWFEAGGLFDFGEEQFHKTESAAVNLLYAAKYDPRGAVSFIQRWKDSERRVTRPLGKIMPETEDRLMNVRQEVAKLSPLRDPVVKSQAFEEYQMRLSTRKAKAKNVSRNKK